MLTPCNRFKTETVIFLWLMLFTVSSALAGKNYLVGARAVALSHAVVSLSDVWSAFHNQAGLADLTNVSSALFFESRFGIRELTLKAGAVVIPGKSGTFGISFYQFGMHEFSTYKAGAAFAKKLDNRWRASLQLDYLMQSLPESGRVKGAATFEAGILYQPDSEIALGIHLYNPVKANIPAPSGPINIPVIFRGGIHYRFENWLLAALEVTREDRLPVVVRTGIELLPSSPLALRLGVSGSPLNYTTGFGYQKNRIAADLGFSYHGNLGLTPSLSVQITL